MALHRDILWIGRQWAVTGHGMQLIDQRLEGAFDIEVIRLWDDDLIESMRAKAWVKAEDFDKGLTVARTRHPRQAQGLVTVQLPAVEPIAPPTPKAPKPERSAPVEPAYVAKAPAAPESPPPPVAVEPPKQQSPDLQMKIEGHARFVRPWRVWMKRKT